MRRLDRSADRIAQPRRRAVMRAVIFVAGIIVSATGLPRAARAEPQEPKEAARAQGKEASSLADQGQHEGALRLFQRAYELDPQPGYLYDVGIECEALGRDAEALDAFEQFLQQPGTTPRSFVTHAGEERRDLRKRVGEIVVRSTPAGAQVSVDDKPRGTTPPPRPILVSPGAHRVVVQAPGFEPFAGTLQVVAGGQLVVDAVLRLEAPANAGAPASALTSSMAGPSLRDDAGAVPSTTGELGRKRSLFYGALTGGAGVWAGSTRGSPGPSMVFGVTGGAVVAALGPSMDLRLGAKVAVAFLSEPATTDRFYSFLVDPTLTCTIVDRWRLFAELGIGVQVLSGIPNDSILLVPSGGRVTGDLAAFELRPAIGAAYSLTDTFSLNLGPALSLSPSPSSRFEHGSVVRVEIAAGVMAEL